MPITAIVTAYKNAELAVKTLRYLHACRPPPDEILVHVDGNQVECASKIGATFPAVKIILSNSNIGPGGGRNKLIAAASNEFIASFDDDSYPIDVNYFARLLDVLDRYPDAAIIAASIYHIGERIELDSESAEWVSDFVGCGCIYRRSAFLKTTGYVPLPVAYGMEEVDIAMQLHAQGQKILYSKYLRVFHATDRSHHNSSAITSASIANLALLGFLRYPARLWPLAVAQCVNRILWLATHRRVKGIIPGILRIPFHLTRYKNYRNPLPSDSIRSYLALRRNPVKAG